MTIDAAIAALTAMKAESPLGGDTCLSVCLVASGVADSPLSPTPRPCSLTLTA